MEKELPISGARLAKVSVNVATIDKAILSIMYNASELVKEADLLKEKEAIDVRSYIQVRNIKKSALDIKTYLGLADMLLCHMRGDLNHIFKQRHEYAKAIEKRKIDMQNAEKMKKCRAKKSSPENQ